MACGPGWGVLTNLDVISDQDAVAAIDDLRERGLLGDAKDGELADDDARRGDRRIRHAEHGHPVAGSDAVARPEVDRQQIALSGHGLVVVLVHDIAAGLAGGRREAVGGRLLAY